RLVVTMEGAALEAFVRKNGTFRGSERVSAPIQLADGDALRVGSVLMIFRVRSFGSEEAQLLWSGDADKGRPRWKPLNERPEAATSTKIARIDALNVRGTLSRDPLGRPGPGFPATKSRPPVFCPRAIAFYRFVATFCSMSATSRSHCCRSG